MEKESVRPAGVFLFRIILDKIKDKYYNVANKVREVDMNLKSKRFLFLLIIILIAFVGCRTKKDVYKEAGLLGEHELRHHERSDYVGSKLSGGFFLGCGGISGSAEAVSQVRFFWVVDSERKEVINTVADLSDIVIIVDNGKEVPTVEFSFCDCHLDGGGYGDSYKISIFELNQQIDYYSEGIILRISKKDLENEIYLPKATR